MRAVVSLRFSDNLYGTLVPVVFPPPSEGIISALKGQVYASSVGLSEVATTLSRPSPIVIEHIRIADELGR